MKLVGFESVEIDQHAHGVVAAKQPNVKFFSSGKKEKNIVKNAPNKRGKTSSSKRRDESFKGGRGRERRGGRGRNSSFDDDDDDEFDVYSSSSS